MVYPDLLELPAHIKGHCTISLGNFHLDGILAIDNLVMGLLGQATALNESPIERGIFSIFTNEKCRIFRQSFKFFLNKP